MFMLVDVFTYMLKIIAKHSGEEQECTKALVSLHGCFKHVCFPMVVFQKEADSKTNKNENVDSQKANIYPAKSMK